MIKALYSGSFSEVMMAIKIDEALEDVGRLAKAVQLTPLEISKLIGGDLKKI